MHDFKNFFKQCLLLVRRLHLSVIHSDLFVNLNFISVMKLRTQYRRYNSANDMYKKINQIAFPTTNYIDQNLYIFAGNEEIITNQIHDDFGPRNWDTPFGYQNRVDDIVLRNVQPYYGNVARRSMKQVDRLGGGTLLSGGRNNNSNGNNNGEMNGNEPDEVGEPVRKVNGGQNSMFRGLDRVQLRSLDHIGGGNLLKRSLDHIGGGNLLKRSLDSLETGDDAGHLLKRAVDSIGGGYLLK